MDSADSNFRACFLGVGDQGKKIGKHVLSEFNSLIGYFQKYRDDDPTFSADRNEHPQLTVLSFNEHQYNPIQDLPQQDLIFLLGSQQDPLLWATREKWISGNKCSFLFTLVLSENGAFRSPHPSSNNESIIFFEESDSEKQIIKFVKDMCRVWMFPRLLSCDLSCMINILSNTKGKSLSFESKTADFLPPFRQFVSDNLETIQRASGIFYIVSSNSGSDFSIRKHLKPVIDEIENAANGECTVIGSDSLYAEREASFRVTMICGEK
jgi:hypothetical protein